MARIEIKSEITGTVWKLTTKPGDRVESGDTLIIIESMKMEIPVITEDGGTLWHGIISDITEIKQLEAALRSHQD